MSEISALGVSIFVTWYNKLILMRIQTLQAISLPCASFQVSLDCLEGDTRIIQVEASDTIEKVHMEIQRTQAADTNEFYLHFGGKPLKSSDQISDCGIGPRSALKMMSPLHGGMDKVSCVYWSGVDRIQGTFMKTGTTLVQAVPV